MQVRSDIQVLRGVAILLVVGYHAGDVIPSGFVGVDVFLVVSGYVISRSTLRRAEHGGLSFGEFMGRRARRILPALSVTLCVTLFLSTWLSPLESRVATVRTGVFASFGGSNLFLARFRPDDYFSQSEKLNALLHTWSLGLEEQMYLFFALALLMITTVGRSEARRVSLWVFGPVGAASLGLCLIASSAKAPELPSMIRRLTAADQFDDRLAFYLPFTRIWEFLVGVALAYMTTARFPKSVNRFFVGIGCALLALSAIRVSGVGYPGPQALAPVAATAMLIHFGNGEQHKSTMFTRTLAWVGDRSYGLYLWHWPVLVFTYGFSNAPIFVFGAVVVSVVLSAMSFKYIEVPFRVSKSFLELWRIGTMSIVAIFAPIAVSVTTFSPIPDLDHHLDTRLGCTDGINNDLSPGGKCVLSVPGSSGSIALVGDSHAGHLSDGMEIVSRELGMNLLLASHAGSPFLLGTRSTETSAMLDFVIKQKVSVAVIAQSGYSVPEVDWYLGMKGVLKTLTDSGVKVVLVAQSVFVDQAPLKCSYLKIAMSKCEADVTLSRSQLMGQRDRLAVELRLISEFPEIDYLDTARFLCPSEDCKTRRDGRWWWRDGGHISVFASRQLAEPLQQAVARLASNENQ